MMRRQRMRHQKMLMIFAVFILVFLWGVLRSVPVFAEVEAGETIRVGYFALTGFQGYDENGNPAGYNVEYLDKLAEYTGWSYEYVHAQSWLEAVEMLRQGKVDIVAPAQRTREREDEFLFSEYSIGTEYGGMLTWKGNDALDYEGFEQFDGITVGCLNSSVLKEQFLQYAQSNGFTPNMVDFDSESQMLSELAMHNVDAIVMNYAESEDTIKLVARFAPSPYYYMMRSGAEPLQFELNAALEKLQSENPAFSIELMAKYFPTLRIIPFTKSELEYAQQAPVLRIGFMIREPLAYYDEDGKPVGILIELMDLIARESGLQFEYVPISGESLSYDDLREYNLSMISGVEFTRRNLQASGISLTDPFFSSQKVLVGKQGIQFSENAGMKVAVSTGSVTLAETVKEKYPNFETVYYDTTEECLEAVLSGEVDLLLQSQYAVEKLLTKPRYEKLVTIPGEGLTEDLCISPLLYPEEKEKADELLADKRLISVLNKAIASISREEMSSIVIAYTVAIPYKVTAEDMLYRFRVPIGIIVLLLICGVSLASLVFHLHNKNVRIIRKNERELSCITNNINGGVVVLIPNKGFAIQYANSGFAKMIGADLDYMDVLVSGSYITYIHDEDIPKLNSLLNKDREDGDIVELELRIRRLDGEYVPAIFHGTIAKDEGKTLLYCVVMDITVQKRMMQRLEEEKERYAMVIEQTDDIIFDIDVEEETATTSNRFGSLFGWEMSTIFDSEEEDRELVFSHEEDKEAVRQMIQAIMDGSNRQYLRLRVRKRTGEYLWCDVIISAVRRKGQLIRLIGKIVDVDEQMREYLRLQDISQKDGMTGLLKKEAFQETVTGLIAEAAGEKSSVLVFVDLDNFKKLNDTLGHQRGDEALKYVAESLKGSFSGDEILGRFGGDEFFLFAQDVDLSAFAKKLDVLGKQMERVFTGENNSERVSVSASMGIAYAPLSEESYEGMLSHADAALYQAKNLGKSRNVIYRADDKNTNTRKA